MSVAEILLSTHSELNQIQIQHFEQDLNTIKNQWNQADIDLINSDSFQEGILNQFDKMLVDLGYGAFDPDSAENLIHKLYLNANYKDVIAYIVLAYRKDNDDVLYQTYELMLHELRGDFENDE